MTLLYFFFTSSNITLLKKIRRNICHLWPKFQIPFRSHVSTVFFYLELVSSVDPDENHWTVKRLWLDLPPGASPTVKRTWERGWSSPLCIIFFQSQYCRYFTNGPKRPCHNQNKNTCKELSPNEACNLNIGTQYWTNLYTWYCFKKWHKILRVVSYLYFVYSLAKGRFCWYFCSSARQQHEYTIFVCTIVHCKHRHVHESSCTGKM